MKLLWLTVLQNAAALQNRQSGLLEELRKLGKAAAIKAQKDADEAALQRQEWGCRLGMEGGVAQSLWLCRPANPPQITEQI